VRTHVGNLAHGLKTPLSVLTNEAAQVRTPLADTVMKQAAVMRRQVDHYLTRAPMRKFEDHDPKTLEEAVECLFLMLSIKERKSLADPDASEGLLSLTDAHNLGRPLRNAWFHRPIGTVSVLSQHFRDRFGLGHPDDGSSLIFEGLFAKIKHQRFDPSVSVERFKSHWKRFGIDPLTLEEVDPKWIVPVSFTFIDQ
jgi:hypothetical protein